ncbi:MAG: UDP-N-acetylmuramate dehydrogenase [Bacteroidaceae bacterium]|nr:UDP-N-acetylmuramate dehydrogenase [Bacteroidaceae bacterium]
MRCYHDFSLRRFNTFGLDVKAENFVEYESDDDLKYIFKTLRTPYLIIGRGSNMLFTHDYRGTVLHCGIRGIDVVGTDIVVGAGEVWDDFVAWTVSNGYPGVENLSLVPGEVGAAAVQNIGAYGVEAKDFIRWVEFVCLSNGETVRLGCEEAEYGYRQSIFKNSLKDKVAVTRVCFHLDTAFVPRLEYGGLRKYLTDSLGHDFEEGLSPAAVRGAVIDIRNSRLPDPTVLGNAGSFFMNPVVDRDVFLRIRKDYPFMPFYEQDGGVKIPAGWMIEQCGWKGRYVGAVGVYERQALVLVNRGGAKGKDIVELSDAIRRDVKAMFGIEIHPEVRII